MVTHPVFLPKELHQQGSLVGYSPWGHKESDTTEWLSVHTQSIAYATVFTLLATRWLGHTCVKHSPADTEGKQTTFLNQNCREIVSAGEVDVITWVRSGPGYYLELLGSFMMKNHHTLKSEFFFYLQFCLLGVRTLLTWDIYPLNEILSVQYRIVD